MSKSHIYSFKCPKCNKKIPCVIYDSINVTLDPELKEKLLDTSLFHVTCPHCHKTFTHHYPFLYHDMEKKFMVFADCYGNVLEDKESLVENPLIREEWAKEIDSINIIGATCFPTVSTIINSYDNNLDYRLVTLLLEMIWIAFPEMIKEEKGINVDHINCVSLVNQHDENGNPNILVAFNDGTKDDAVVYPFPLDTYEELKEDHLDRLNLINPFIFEIGEAMDYFEQYEEDFYEHEKHKTPYIYLGDFGTNTYLAKGIPSYLKDSIKPGNHLIVKSPHGFRDILTVKRIKELNDLCLKVPDDDLVTILSEFKEVFMETSYDSNATLGQDDLVEELVKFKGKKEHTRMTGELANMLKNSNMFICSMTTLEVDYDNISILTKKDVLTGLGKEITRIQKIRRDNKVYLALYTDPFYLPDESEMLSNAVFPFNDLVRVIKNDPRYEGIVINQYDQDITLTFDDIYTYIWQLVISDRKKIIEFINSLTPNEEEYFGDKLIYLKEYRLDNFSLKEMEKKHNLTIQELMPILDECFTKIREILYARF